MIREIAVRAGLKLSEYGLFRAETRADRRRDRGGRLRGAGTAHRADPSRGSRRDRGSSGRRPAEIIRETEGDLHTHTNLTDGVASLEGDGSGCGGSGYAYYAVTDHAPNLAMQRMTDDKILAQREQVDRSCVPPHDGVAPRSRAEHRSRRWRRLGRRLPRGVRRPRRIGAFALLPVPGRHDPPVVRAMENPYVNVIGHLSTRQIGKRARWTRPRGLFAPRPAPEPPWRSTPTPDAST